MFWKEKSMRSPIATIKYICFYNLKCSYKTLFFLGVKVSDLPGPEALYEPGRKDGQTKVHFIALIRSIICLVLPSGLDPEPVGSEITWLHGSGSISVIGWFSGSVYEKL